MGKYCWCVEVGNISMNKLRLLKITLQVTAAIEDDSGNLTEKLCEPVVISSKDRPAFIASGGVFDTSWEILRRQVEDSSIEADNERIDHNS